MMLPTKTLLTASFATVLLCFTTTTDAATNITILNPGFEVDDVADNTGVIQTPDDWILNSGGSFHVDKAWLGGTPHNAGIAGAHTGDQYWLGSVTSGTAILTQDTPLLWSELTVGDTLSMSYWATYRSDFPGSPTAAMWLNLAEGGLINSLSRGPDQDNLANNWFNVSSTSANAAGAWTQYAWSVEITQADIDAATNGGWGAVNVGIGFADSGGGSQVAFDDVSLTYTEVPEPSSLALLGLGGLLIARRRRS